MKFSRFLDSVQANDGAAYRYDRGSKSAGLTDVGLYCRIHLGWKKDRPALVAGAQRVEAIGPSLSNIYHMYYGTQLLYHLGGNAWRRWDARVRPYLVTRQSRNGHTAGSWHFGSNKKNYVQRGGRLYVTAMAALTLETPYRHERLYK